MITVKFTIPELAGKFTIYTPKLYVWFAYFWGDIHTLGTPQPISVFVPPSSDTRDAYPIFQVAPAVLVPSSFGTFQVNLDDAGAGFAAAGVLVLVLGQHDTPDDAISAGYSAFATAVSQQLNSYVTAHGFVAPNPGQITALANAIDSAVTSAISNKLSDWDKFLTWTNNEVQDEFIGYSYKILLPGQLTPAQSGPLNLPKIENQIEYSFPLAKVEIQAPTTDPCQSLVVAANQAAAKVTALLRQLHQLQAEFAAANPAQKAVIGTDMNEILNTTLPAAKTALTSAQRALQRCRLLPNLQPLNSGARP